MAAARDLSNDYYKGGSSSSQARKDDGEGDVQLVGTKSGYETDTGVGVPQSGVGNKKDLASYETGGVAGGDASVLDGFEESPKKQTLPFIVFLMIGTSELAGWNALLNAMPNVVANVFQVDDYSDTVTATYSTVLLVLTIFFIKFNVANLWTIYIGLALQIVAAIVFGVGVQVAKPEASSAIMHTLSAILAVSSATLGSSAFGFAAQFPYNYGGAMSAGLGMAGVVTFVVWMVGSHGIWDSSVSGTKSALWLLMVVIVLVTLIALVLSFYLFNRADVKEMFAQKAVEAEMAKNKVHELEAEGAGPMGTYETEGLKGVLRRSALLGFAYFCCMYVTLICFPIIGPLHWLKPGLEADILMGTFQIMDLVGRYAPNYLAFMRLEKKAVLVTFALARYGFVVLFILSSRLSGKPVIGQFWFMFLEEFFLAGTNGWLCTAFFLVMPNDVEGDEAKVRVASVALLATFLGICAGQWTGKGIVSIP